MRRIQSEVVLTHHWIFQMRGGEKVLEQFCELFPNADIACLAYDGSTLSHTIRRHRVFGSWLQRLGGLKKLYKQLLPLHPFLIRRMKLPDSTKIALASDASLIKGIKIGNQTKLICYCHSPPRYVWEMTDEYAENTSGLGFVARAIFKYSIASCKKFDQKSAERVDLFIANSNFVAERIKRHYGSESTVVYPPVATEDFEHERPRRDFYLVVSALVAYKKIDVAVEAFNANGLPLVVIGDGPERSKLEAMASSNIQFMGRQDFSVLKEHYETCKAFIFPGIEDFGITPLEAQASGAPVLAFAEGGALETVLDGQTGVFFHSQDASSLNDAITKLEGVIQNDGPNTISAECRANAERFSAVRFRAEMMDAIDSFLAERNS